MKKYKIRHKANGVMVSEDFRYFVTEQSHETYDGLNTHRVGVFDKAELDEFFHYVRHGPARDWELIEDGT